MKILFNCSNGREDPERATLPFIAATAALASGHEPIVVCTVDAVWLGTVGGRDGIQAEGLQSLDELYGNYVRAGGVVWLCSSCTKPRGIDESNCDRGATIAGATAIVAELAAGAQSISVA